MTIRLLLLSLVLGAFALRAAGSPLESGDVELRVSVPGDPLATDTLQRAIDSMLTAAPGQRVADVELTLPAGAVIRLAGASSFIPPPLPGFGAFYGSVRAVIVDRSGQETLEPGLHEIEAGQWIAVRSRFQTVALSGIVAGEVDVAIERENEPVVTIAPAAGSLKLRAYSGPIESGSLRAADPVLSKMLFAALWNWLRWLCFGMVWLLTTIDGFVGHIGWSIILLSLAVKILMLPLTKYADSLQASVNRTQALLQPQIDEIKKNFKGEEAHEKILAVYKQHGVNPLYTMKSLLGFLLQIPIFIAAFDMLGENIALDGASLWWIDDLAKPDSWIALPFALPFFGGYLNLLPILMTGVTLLTSWKQTDPNLTPELERAQTQRLYLMAGAFFLLFYTFPAGMVLYWTTNNVLHLVKITVWGRTSATV
ncbi:MAG: membrane protein insertase YidC [Gammaproteobacteria bacterium]|nr:membrane protein insertase YidC [Gammaproteobacteria bacterium]